MSKIVVLLLKEVSVVPSYGWLSESPIPFIIAATESQVTLPSAAVAYDYIKADRGLCVGKVTIRTILDKAGQVLLCTTLLSILL